MQSACRRHLREFPTPDYLVDRDGESNLRLFLSRVGNTKIREDIAETWNHLRLYKDIFRPEKRQGQELTTAHLRLLWPNGCLNRKKDFFPDRQRIRLLARYGGPTALEISVAFSGSVGKNLRQTTRKAATIGTER